MDAYFTTTPASSLDISQRDLLAVGYGPHVQVWKDVFSGQKQKKPYMRHQLPGSQVSNLRFRPFEDVMAIGHRTGISSMIVRGVRARSARISLFFQLLTRSLTKLMTLTLIPYSQEYDSNFTKTQTPMLEHRYPVPVNRTMTPLMPILTRIPHNVVRVK